MPTDISSIFPPLASEGAGQNAPLDRETPLPARGGSPDTPAHRTVEALYVRHKRFVFRLALRYGKGDVSWAEDVTHDVFIDLLKALPTLTDLHDIERWLYRITANRCFKRLRRERFLSLPPIRWLLGASQAEPCQPDVLAEAHEDIQRATAALEKLPVKERMAFSMYYLDGRSQDEIGMILGHSKSYVCKLIQRAVAGLEQAGWKVDHGAA